MDQGYLPNFQNYLDENPDVRRAITAYDGNIYHIPYIAELNNFARSFCARQSWVVMLLDVDDAPYDTATELTCHYKASMLAQTPAMVLTAAACLPWKASPLPKRRIRILWICRMLSR